MTGFLPDPAEGNVLRSVRDVKVCVLTFGCTYNQADAGKIAEVLKHQGCTIVDLPEDAEAVIVNTCTVIASTERKMLRLIADLKDRPLYVSGCMGVVQRDRILEVAAPGFISPGEIQREYRRVNTVSASPVGIVQIASGCPGSCAYCITRKARGPLRSFPREEIVEHARKLARGGACEIRITAQDVSAWGLDRGEDLPDLLSGLCSVPGNFFLRLGMMNPATLLPLLTEIIRSFRDDKVFKFLHLPVQSGSDQVLAGMQRHYSVDDFERIVNAFREKFPSMYLMTDLICGFPGETEEDIGKTIDLLYRVKPNKVNITRYSWRPLTIIPHSGDLPDRIKKDRSRLLLKHATAIYHELNRQWIGKTVPLVVTERIREGSVSARTPEYHNVILREDLPPGFRCHARITGERMYYLTGERCEPSGP
ncbi:MiaB/RimO family radical SAM methylthiotransferase [Methanolinea mesophila]|uniref:radical SAM protein n=1 Tax=Methanolinea mesophila TaxID=547055 RepID=UPI001AE9EF12|nr:radical SAM protein [Methanolinea mesophila]MBP1928561.1 MiaB/RimO family radical SAM methylthiotransferase [Methanolinea mesophila]